jgi:prenyltransferase beta subunit
MTSDSSKLNSSDGALGRELTTLPPALSAAGKYLVEAQETGGGWSYHNGGPISLYHTAVVLAALASADREKFSTDIAQGAYKARAIFGADLTVLVSLEAAYLLRASIAEATPDSQWVQSLVQAIQERLWRELQHPETIRTRDFAETLLILARAKNADKELLSRCANHLVEMERDGDGSWSGDFVGERSVVVTAMAILALDATDKFATGVCVKRGLNYIENAISEGGWEQIGVGSDNFATAVVLRAMAECGDSTRISEGIVVLQSSQNSDGGWGGGPGEPSNNETTAVALSALIACGENRFVTQRAALARISEITARYQAVDSELLKLKRDIEEQVNKRSGKLVEDRDSLRREVERLRKTMMELQQKSEIAQEAAFRERERYRTLSNYLSRDALIPDQRARLVRLAERGALLLIGVISVLTLFLDITGIRFFGFSSSRIFIPMIGISGMGLLATSFLTELFNGQRLSSRLKIEYSMESLHSSRERIYIMDFMEITSELDPRVREELTYALISRIGEMPPDVGMRALDSLVDRYGLDSRIRRPLLHWLESFLVLSLPARRTVLEELRRQSLLG